MFCWISLRGKTCLFRFQWWLCSVFVLKVTWMTRPPLRNPYEYQHECRRVCDCSGPLQINVRYSHIRTCSCNTWARYICSVSHRSSVSASSHPEGPGQVGKWIYLISATGENVTTCISQSTSLHTFVLPYFKVCARVCVFFWCMVQCVTTCVCAFSVPHN